MDPTYLLSFTVGLIIGGGLGYVFLSARAFDKRFKASLDRQREEAIRAH